MISSRESTDSGNKNNKHEKLFFFYSQKPLDNEQKYIEQCEQLARQCDELKSQMPLIQEPEPEPPKTSSPTKEQPKGLRSFFLKTFIIICCYI